MPEVGKFDSGTSGAVLPQGEHACRLTSVVMGKGKDFNTKEEIDQWEFTFESMQRKDADGNPEVITLWTGLNYGNDKAKLTKLMDQVFGRSLTQAEWRALDFDKMVGLTGWVMVLPHTKQDGTKTSKFGAFRHPENVTPPSPSQFAGTGVSAPAAIPAQQTAPTNPFPNAAPAGAFPATPAASPFPTQPPAGEVPNPWATAQPDTNGTGAHAPF